jgi:uncharacterized protein YmfQ (DUF2313 family)
MTDTFVNLDTGAGGALGVGGGAALQVSGGLNPANVRQAPAPSPAAADYLAALQKLMPRGRVWPRSPTAIITLVLTALALTFWRLDQAAGALLQDLFPATAVNMLPEWELSLGLPDPCIGEEPTLQARQAQVVQRLVSTGGQSVNYFTELAASLGYAITITEFTGAQAHTWQVNCPQAQAIYFRAGQSAAGEPLLSGGSAVLECLFNELKPAQTTVTFVYG